MSHTEFDYVIVGAGSAGCVLANRLSKDPDNRVALLEAGPPDRNVLIHMPGGFGAMFGKRSLNWRYKTVPQKHLDNRVIYDRRGKTLGGSSSINGMIYCRGAAQDYDHWAASGAPGWSYADVLPYFKMSEDHELGASEFHGAGGPLRVSRSKITNPLSKAWLEAAQQAGFPLSDDINGRNREGLGPADLTISGPRRWSTATGFLKPVANRPNLTVITMAHATRVLFDGLRATGVEYTHGGGKYTAEARAQVILCGGVYQTPQLLLLSGVGNGQELAQHGIKTVHELTGVGLNLHDHLGYRVQASCPKPISLASLASPARASAAGLQYMLLRSGPMARTQWEVAGMINSGVTPEAHPDTKVILVLMMMPPRTGSVSLKEKTDYGVMATLSLTRPESRGSMRLRSADPFDPPLIDPNYLAEESDLRRARESIKRVRSIFEQPAYQPFLGNKQFPGAEVRSDAQIDRYLRETAVGDNHAVGTCRMGTDDDAVVDEKLRVRGLENLRIADASVMPVVVSGNTNAPVVMIAERAAEFLLDQRGQSLY